MVMSDIRKYRMTKQRQVILEELGKTRSHPTASQLYDIVRTRLPRISLGTVYRNLEVLEKMGKVNLITIGKMRRYDADIYEHNHIRCISCGKVDDYPSVSINISRKNQDFTPDFEVIGHAVNFYGVCGACREKGFKADKINALNGLTKN